MCWHCHLSWRVQSLKAAWTPHNLASQALYHSTDAAVGLYWRAYWVLITRDVVKCHKTLYWNPFFTVLSQIEFCMHMLHSCVRCTPCWCVANSLNPHYRVTGKKPSKRTKSINGSLYIFRGRINTEVMEVENVEDGTGKRPNTAFLTTEQVQILCWKLEPNYSSISFFSESEVSCIASGAITIRLNYVIERLDVFSGTGPSFWSDLVKSLCT